jgi:flagellum-specific peptidoglycan hydrolase FlgJ
VVQLATSGIEATVLQVNNDRSILIKMGSLRVTASLTDIKSIRNGGHESVREDSNESHRQSQQTKSKKRKKKNKAAVKFSQRLQESALQQRNNESEEDDAEAEHSDVHEVRQSEENQQSDQQKRECSQSLADQLQKATGRARPP